MLDPVWMIIARYPSTTEPRGFEDVIYRGRHYKSQRTAEIEKKHCEKLAERYGLDKIYRVVEYRLME